MGRERQQMETYAAAVAQQQRRDREAAQAQADFEVNTSPHSQQIQQGGGGEGGAGEGGWQAILRLDPLADKLRRSKLARIAFRRCAAPLRVCSREQLSVVVPACAALPAK